LVGRPGVADAMARALPHADAALARRLAVAEARFQLRQSLERLVFPRLDRCTVTAHVAVEGLDAVHSAMAAGTPVLLIAGHLGTHGLPPIVLDRLGIPVQVRTFQRPDDALEGAQGWGQARRRQMEDRLGVRYLRVGSAGDRPRAVLAEGGVLLTTGDGLGPGRIVGESSRPAALGLTRIAWPDAAYALGREAGAAILGLLLDDRPDGPVLRLTPLAGPQPFEAFVARYRTLWRLRPETWQFWDQLAALEEAA